MCVHAVITTFSKHLQPPDCVFIAGKGMGQQSLEKSILKDGRQKGKIGGLEDDQKSEGGSGGGEGGGGGARRPACPPIATCRLREVRKDLAFLGKEKKKGIASGDGDLRSLPGQDFTTRSGESEKSV